MAINYKDLEKALAQNKVYNAWQYGHRCRKCIT